MTSETKKKWIEDWLSQELDEKSLEEILEYFDLSPYEVLWNLFQLGLIDEEIIEMKHSI